MMRIASERSIGAGLLKRTLVACAALCALGTAVSAESKGTYTTIDVPGSQFTSATGINADGVITGYYGYCGGSVAGSFVRAADGTITTFNLLPCKGNAASGTIANSVNKMGTITGTVRMGSAVSYGFVRKANGRSRLFTIPVQTPNFRIFSTGINYDGATTGTAETDTDRAWGFVRGSDGKIALFRAHGSNSTYALSINNSGTIVGYYGNPDGFVRSVDGTVTTIRPKGSIDSRAVAINNIGEITGYYNDTKEIDHGFVRAPDGTITSFIVFGTTQMTPMSINDKGEVAGSYTLNDTFHGFVRTPDGKIESFDPPGSWLTYPLAINKAGAITGYYVDGGGTQHGFLRAP